MRKNRAILLFLSLVALAFPAFGQEADSYYPFTVECSQEAVLGGETTAYTVKFPPQAKLDNFVFNWTMSAGEIIEGQGKTSIKVKLPQYASSATANVELVPKQPIFPGSQTTAQCTVPVIPIPQPILEDELGNSWNCEESLARLDSFFSTLANDPSAQGFIVFRIDKDTFRKSLARERQFKNSIKMRRFDSSRITFVRGAAHTPENVKTEFWLVPPGAAMKEVPPFEAAHKIKISENKTDNQPYIFGVKTTDGVAECASDYYDLEEYAAYLKLNPKARANIVIKEATRARFQNQQKEILSELAASGIATNRLKFFFVKVKHNMLHESVELWIVP